MLESNFLSNLLLSAVEKISRGSQSWPSIRWETESSMHSFLRGELSLLFLEIFLICRSVHYMFESHPPQIWTRAPGCSLVAAWPLRGTVSSASCVWKNQLSFRPFFSVYYVYLKAARSFSQSESWKPGVFTDASLKCQKVECVGILILAVTFYGYRCIFVVLDFGLFASGKTWDGKGFIL